MTDDRTRKRRGDLNDQMGAPDYHGDPIPPYIGLAEGMIYASFTIDPSRVAPHLPQGLTMAEPASAIWVVAPFADLGWGLRDSVNIFPGVVVNEWPSPDTAEACFIPLSAMSGPARTLTSRYFNACVEGDSRSWIDGDVMRCEVSTERGVALTITIRLGDQTSENMVSQDRYIGVDGQGRLVSFIVSASGRSRAADLIGLEITAEAPEVWQALRPVALNFALLIPQMIANKSAPEPILTDEALLGAAASRRALLDILDRQARACAILSAQGAVLHANSEARRLLARLPQARRDPVRMPEGADQARFLAGLRAAAGGRQEGGRQEGVPGQFLVAGVPDSGPLILQLTALDPALSGPGTVLALFSDPADRPTIRDPGLLQLLGLTPAEARIAAAVGSGLPPREAASRLGLAESSVRSALKMIFDKLGIRRQAELVQIVAKLEAR